MALPVLSHFKHRGKNPRLDFWIGRRGGCVVSSLGKSPRWLVESSVHQLESVMATAKRVSFHIVDNASWSMPALIGLGPAIRSPNLDAFERSVRWLVSS
jgi:hypothetical protein